MKKSILPSLLMVVVCALITGCSLRYGNGAQVRETTTVFGVQGRTPQLGGIGPIVVQAGLIRNSYFSNPVGTNKMYSAPFNSATAGKVSALHQNAGEFYGTHKLQDGVFLVLTNQ